VHLIGLQGKSAGIAASAAVWMFLASPPALSEPAAGPPSKPPAMQCFFGPVARTIGGAPWLLYACDDGKSLVVVTDQHNPASPFYFVISPHGATFNLNGEGTGSKVASDAAGDELSKMSVAQVAELWAQAKKVGRSRP
jgi:hypothetical protein